MRLLRFLGAMVACAIVLGSFAYFAFAQGAPPNTVVTWQWGDWLAQVFVASMPAILPVVLTGIALVFSWLGRKLPGQAVAVLKMMRIEQLMNRLAIRAINATPGAVKGRALEFDVGNQVLAKITRDAIEEASKGLIADMGGAAGIRAKALGRIDIAETAKAMETAAGPVLVPALAGDKVQQSVPAAVAEAKAIAGMPADLRGSHPPPPARHD
ncbi:hypothetical protein BH10PSE7_BH10PSE7_15630 [soil metagenome]